MVRGLRAEKPNSARPGQAEQFERTVDELRAELDALKAKLDRAHDPSLRPAVRAQAKPPNAPGDAAREASATSTAVRHCRPTSSAATPSST